MDFSFMYADSNNTRSLKVGGSAFVIFPDGKHVYESDYEGNGLFAGKDIYELVVDWNEEHLKTSLLNYPKASEYADLRSFADAKRAYDSLCEMLDDLLTKPVTYMNSKYGREYKHKLGVAIAGSDAQNMSLPFPIKISENLMPYDILPASAYDPNQGVDLVRETTEEWHGR